METPIIADNTSMARSKEPARHSGVELSVVVPMYNEEENVATTAARVVEALESYSNAWELILVNDGSTDRTLNIARAVAAKDPRIRMCSYAKNKGMGKALRVGFANACGDIIVTIDADLGYDPRAIPNLVTELRVDEDLDIVVGSPHMKGGGTENVPWFRLLISKLGNKVLSLVMNAGLSAMTSIFVAYRRDVLESLDLESNDKDISLEILSKAIAIGFQVKEVPAILKGREHGRSKFNLKGNIISHFLFSVFEKPILLFGILGVVLAALGTLAAIYIIVLWQRRALDPERPLVTLMVLLILAGLQFVSFGFVGTQLVSLRKEILKVQRENRLLSKRINTFSEDHACK